MKKRLKIQFYGDPLNDSEVFDRTWIIQLYWGLHDSPSFGSSCGRLVLVLWCLHLNPTLSLVVFYLKTTRNSAIRKRKESLAVEKRCVVWVWKSTETFQKCFTFHFQRWIVVYLWHTVFFFLFCPPLKGFWLNWNQHWVWVNIEETPLKCMLHTCILGWYLTF